jgi:DNA repair photolyase
MKVIYEPQGRAREFSPLAANLYRGCAHGCIYCYAPQAIRVKREQFVTQPKPRTDVLKYLKKDARKLTGDDREILLSFTCDPYQPIDTDLGITREAIKILIENHLRFTILTKGGLRAVRDFDLLENYAKCRFGTTLVFTRQPDADQWEPGAASLAERIEALKSAHSRGIPTWVSLEPVIDPAQALAIIKKFHPIVDQWNVGKLNYRKPDTEVDWVKFREEASALFENLGADVVMKKSLLDLG